MPMIVIEQPRPRMQPEMLKNIQNLSRDEAAIHALFKDIQSLGSPEEQQPKRLALVVDDDPLIKEVVRKILEKDDFAVMTAANGQSCLNILNTVKPSLIVLDLLLPDLNGDQIFQKIREIPKTTIVPVIFMSGEISPEEEKELNSPERPLEKYLSKPFTSAKLIEFANELVNTSLFDH
jgi:CheY-like chemotaxis protein